MRRLIAWVLGRRLIVLEDFDGDLNVRIERKDALGRSYAVRVGMGIRNVWLEEGGRLSNGSYVKRWHLIEDYRR